MAAKKIRNTRRVKRSRMTYRRRRGGYRTNMTYDDEKNFMRNIVNRINEAQTTADEHAAYDTMARFLLHCQHLIHSFSFRQAAIRKLVTMLNMSGLPEHSENIAEEALERMQSYESPSNSNNSNNSNN
jgi:hypothetical protein